MDLQIPLAELLERWRAGAVPPAFLGAQVALALAALTLALRLAQVKPALFRPLSVLAALGAAAAGVKAALAQAWLADDAFITFRYARHLAEGHGLVWNVGERVEGYTNFLWTVLLAAAHRAGLEAPWASTAMTLAALVALATVSAVKLSRPGWLPLAPVLLALAPALAEFGTSGLEAGPTATCIGFAALWLLQPATRHAAAWWVLTAALLRPDHALFFAPLGLVQVRAGRRALVHLAAAAAAFAAYWVGRWAYFGELLPNTFHAKSGGGAYWSQGLTYWAEFALATGLWAMLPAALLVGAVLWRRNARRAPLPGSALGFAALGAALYTAYIARVGGDFMEFRFGLTTLVLAALGADLLLSRLAEGPAWAAALAALGLVPLGVTPRLIERHEKRWHIARESTFYPVKRWSPLALDTTMWDIGVALGSLPDRGAHAPPLTAGCIGMAGYLSEVPIIDRYGLTNRAIARKPIERRGRPGHEKLGTLEEVLAEGAVWSIDPLWPQPLEAATRVRLGGSTFWVLRATPALAAAVPGAPRLEDILSVIGSRDEAREQLAAVEVLAAGRPGALEAFVERWGLVDVRQLTLEGPSLTRTASGATAEGTLTLGWRRPCARPVRLRWSVEGGACVPAEAACVDGQLTLAATCTGAHLRVERFTLEPLDGEERLRRGLGQGPLALAEALRGDDGLAAEGYAGRFTFDDAAELSRPGFSQSAAVYAVSTGPEPGQAAVSGKQGRGFLNGFAHGDGPRGTLRLTLPVEPGVPVLVSFLFAGGAACELISARVLDGAREVLRACARQDEVLRPHAAVVRPAGAALVLEVLDAEDKGWGHALVDDFFAWRLPAAP